VLVTGTRTRILIVVSTASNWLTVRNLIEALESLPSDLPVMLPAESNVDYAYAAYVQMVVRDARDWSGTPVGQFLLVERLPTRDSQESAEPRGWDAYAPRPSGEPFQAVVLDLDPPPERRRSADAEAASLNLPLAGRR
jgi:hypothetical protein